MTDSPKVTISHQEIREWAERYQGKPQAIGTNGTTVIRIKFAGQKDDNFLSDHNPPRYISWEDFFRVFEDHDLAFIYEDRDNIYDPSLGYHFIKRENVEEENPATPGGLFL